MEQREQILLGSVLVLGLAVGVYLYAWPMWNRYHAMEGEIEKTIEKYRQAEGDAKNLDELFDRERKLERQLAKLRSRLPDDSDFIRLTRILEEEATNAGIDEDKISQFNQAGQQEGDLINELFIQAEFKQLTMEEAIDLLWQYENLDRLMDVREFTFTPAVEEEQLRVDVSMRFVVYAMPEDQQLEEVS